ncbi:type II toxin-antitoxin system death-on-curing family toxin [Brevifollis gellanilyticus]|uniref:Death-on-curing protein n=1 Tax=Brevifollis gellanilyticus TaxID=748831 RepID=A0A512MH44_9BACT|nr:type II toxin-antitoxin system death-on-curing family toxin [Brevifollis gellanilyticus]GEP45671.1 death-on-curing protein [Brevifollis gellanilyticus]
MREPQWIFKETILLLHEQSLNEHGGSSGLRDDGLLDSALGKPQNVHAYNAQASIFDLAASYATGLVKNHPFIDGNKRIGFLAGALMLQLNGYHFAATEADAAISTLALAAGEMTEAEYAAWLEKNSTPYEA